MNIVGMSFSEGGRSLQIELRASIPPYEYTTMTLQNAFYMRLSQAPDEGFPYFVPEMHWRPIPDNDKVEILRQMQYDLFGRWNKPLIADRVLLLLEIEGDICGQIIMESVVFDEWKI